MITLLIDWISVTDKNTPQGVPQKNQLLTQGSWVECKGKNGYTLGQKHSTGVRDYMNLARPDMGRHTVYSGKSLARIKEKMNISAEQVLIHHIKSGHNIARLDLAIDFKGFGIPVDEYIREFQCGNIKTKLRKATVVKSLVGDGSTLYIGSMEKRKNLIRVYDKGAETETYEDWIRVELQIMGKKATGIGLEISKSENIKESIIGTIKGVADFHTIPSWKALTSDIGAIKMESIPKTQGDTEKWLMKQVAPAMARTIVLNIDFHVQFRDEVERLLAEHYDKVYSEKRVEKQ